MTKMKKFYSADILTHEEVLLNTKAITSIKDVPWCKACVCKELAAIAFIKHYSSTTEPC